jgi:sugar lactone lactonase YvrE
MQSHKHMLREYEREYFNPKRLAVASSSSHVVASTAASVPHRLRLSHRDFLPLARDALLFFSVLPKDAFLMIAELLRCRRRGVVRDPNALQFDRAVLRSFKWPMSWLCLDQSENLVLPLYTKNEVHVYSQLGTLVRKVGVPKVHHNSPYACVVDSRGRLFVSESKRACVMVFRADGSPEGSIGNSYDISGARGLDLSLDELVLYVVSFHSGTVKSYRTDTGALVGRIGNGRLKSPMGVAVLSNGHIAVSSCHHNSELFIFTADGAVVRSFGYGELDYPRQIAVDSRDNLYVTNGGPCDVVVYSPDGRKIGRLGHDASGKYTTTKTTPSGYDDTRNGGTADGQFLIPSGIAIDSQGNVIVAEYKGRRVQFFKSV